MADTDLTEAIADTVAMVTASLADTVPAAGSPALSELFGTLTTSASTRARVEAEDEIWAQWYRHTDPDLELRMDAAIAAMARHDLATAASLLDALIEDAPDWAEGWNKRATVHFMAGRDAASIRDIQHTLTLEPRHFGAIGGFGQICLRAGDLESALIAFQVAVRLNPNLIEMHQLAARLAAQLPRTVH